MKTYLYLSVLALAFQTQGLLAQEVDADLQEAPQAQSTVVQPITNQQTQTTLAPPTTSGVVILNQQPAPIVQQQPTTYVEASPLTASRADQLRQHRQEVEVQTEQKIVEKLEQSRLEDEKDRADRLFGDKLEKQEAAPQAIPTYNSTQPAAPMNAVQVVPVQEPVKDTTSDEIRVMKEELSQSINSLKEEAKEEKKQSYYFSAGLGSATYPGVENVEGNLSAGFAVGTMMANRVIVEGSFIYSNYYIAEYWRYNPFREMDQYNIALALKYSLLPGMFRPIVGASAGYTYRKYFDREYNYYGYYNGTNEEEITSNAFDVGAIVGIELDATDNFTIGVEYRYNINMLSKNNDDLWAQDYLAPGNTSPVEELDYYTLTVNGKIRF